MGFELMAEFIGRFQLLIAIPYGTISDSYSLQFTATNSITWSAIVTSPLVPVSNGGRFHFTMFQNCPRA
jgi:hypothetical protein